MNSSAHRIESRFISQTYKYDAANRLIGSDGSMSQEYSTALPYGYQSSYKYTLAGRLMNKYVKSDRLSTSQGPHHVAYDNTYSYTHPDNPYAVTHIQDAYGAHYDFDWDANGNLTDSRAHATHTDRRLCWTEDNRLQAFMERGDEGGTAAYYNYSADGERNIKLTSPRLNIQQNASLFSNPPLVYPTLYASSLVTLTKQGYTKHYFEEGRRICSKIGGGMQGNVTVEEIDSRVPELTYNYDDQCRHQYDGIRHTFSECVEADPQIIDGVNLHRMLVDREVRRDEEEPAFFYHSDHLGSAAYLTHRGSVIQTLNYLPYGEDWVELNFFDPHDTTRLGIYRFNGKEKDYESGFHYYGARYYWDETLTGWLSVDPLTDDFPYISCYNYCEQNPVKLKDLDGEGPVLGAVVGFIVEYGCQVAENWASGNHSVDMFVPNDGVMLAAATLEGAVTCGVSAGKTVARKAAFTAARSVYVGAKEGSIAAGVNNAIVETVGNVVGGGVPKAKPKVVKAVKKIILKPTKRPKLLALCIMQELNK